MGLFWRKLERCNAFDTAAVGVLCYHGMVASTFGKKRCRCWLFVEDAKVLQVKIYITWIKCEEIPRQKNGYLRCSH